ncbi:MAG: hypothetical protein J5930_01655 [Treponema sp.]|nr:hypothetical protein [Treponema sp.]
MGARIWFVNAGPFSFGIDAGAAFDIPFVSQAGVAVGDDAVNLDRDGYVGNGFGTKLYLGV